VVAGQGRRRSTPPRRVENGQLGHGTSSERTADTGAALHRRRRLGYRSLWVTERLRELRPRDLGCLVLVQRATPEARRLRGRPRGSCRRTNGAADRRGRSMRERGTAIPRPRSPFPCCKEHAHQHAVANHADLTGLKSEVIPRAQEIGCATSHLIAAVVRAGAGRFAGLVELRSRVQALDHTLHISASQRGVESPQSLDSLLRHRRCSIAC
jgi:hypothetical protein